MTDYLVPSLAAPLAMNVSTVPAPPLDRSGLTYDRFWSGQTLGWLVFDSFLRRLAGLRQVKLKKAGPGYVECDTSSAGKSERCVIEWVSRLPNSYDGFLSFAHSGQDATKCEWFVEAFKKIEPFQRHGSTWDEWTGKPPAQEHMQALTKLTETEFLGISRAGGHHEDFEEDRRKWMLFLEKVCNVPKIVDYKQLRRRRSSNDIVKDLCKSRVLVFLLSEKFTLSVNCIPEWHACWRRYSDLLQDRAVVITCPSICWNGEAQTHITAKDAKKAIEALKRTNKEEIKTLKSVIKKHDNDAKMKKKKWFDMFDDVLSDATYFDYWEHGLARRIELIAAAIDPPQVEIASSYESSERERIA